MEDKNKKVSFEENLDKLEKIVKALESGETPLDDAIKKYNEAIIIAKVCDEKLKNAEKNVNMILNNDKLEEFEVLE